jgi:uncharacterized cupin superfamily protein
MSDPSVENMRSPAYLHAVSTRTDLVDWGVQPNAVRPGSHSSGKLIHKGPGNIPEIGIWVCTPGTWRLSIPRNELCHFVEGCATYCHDDGEVIEVVPETVVLFPAGWSGECTVHETMRNIYILA